VQTRIGASLAVAIGAPIAFEDIATIRDRQTLADDLGARVGALAAIAPKERAKPRRARIQPRPR
jgi:hypothetical protein